VIKFLFNLLRIDESGLKWNFNPSILVQPTVTTRTQYTKCRLWSPPEDKQVMLETCRGPSLLINWIKSASRWFHCTDSLSMLLSLKFRNFQTTHFRCVLRKSKHCNIFSSQFGYMFRPNNVMFRHVTGKKGQRYIQLYWDSDLTNCHTIWCLLTATGSTPGGSSTVLVLTHKHYTEQHNET
jgi:hypothetical protein